LLGYLDKKSWKKTECRIFLFELEKFRMRYRRVGFGGMEGKHGGREKLLRGKKERGKRKKKLGKKNFLRSLRDLGGRFLGLKGKIGLRRKPGSTDGKEPKPVSKEKALGEGKGLRVYKGSNKTERGKPALDSLQSWRKRTARDHGNNCLGGKTD